MKKHFILLLAMSAAFSAAAQKPYFQQRANISMQVELDDTLHQLQGDWAMTYVNQSPDTLEFIYIHLWPNAYRNNRTALAKQLLATGKKSWYFAPPAERGYIDNIAFADAQGALRWEYDTAHIDIAKVFLRAPLLPKDSVQLQTPFLLQFPKTISRLGHVEQSYQVTQWYPKPAVYDRKGWHAMPYLDQGEFYSEFGDFDVSIRLPRNYVVGASGDLQTESEIKWLDSLAKVGAKANHVQNSLLPDTFPPTAREKKTIRYKLSNAHDFAWFADKRFYVLKDSVALASGRYVTVYAMFSHTEANLWQNAAMYLKRSVRFYSDVVGEYPYNVATAVQSALSAGGGMEYPTITVIGESGNGKALDNVITHEIGHNWFYGILATNERIHPWMDEGWNSYVESRYMDTYYTGRDKQGYLAFLLQARRGQEQAIQTESDDATSFNYYVTAYAKPTLVFRHAERYLGTARMDSILHEYYRLWAFKHPYPEDLQAVFEQQTGESWQWLFDECIGTTKRVDYAIKKYKFEDGKAEITVANKGTANIVVSIMANDKDGKILNSYWFRFAGADTTIVLENLPLEVASFELDAFRNMPDVRPNDNKVTLKGYENSNALKVKLLADFRAPEKPRINLLPILGYNKYDGFMLGMAVYNLPVPLRKWQYIVAPMFGFGSKRVVGFAQLEYNHFRADKQDKKGLRGLTIGASLRTFDYNAREGEVISRDTANPIVLDSYAYHLRYSKFNLYGIFWLPNRLRNPATEQYLRVDNLFFAEEVANFIRIGNLADNLYTFGGKNTRFRSTHRLTYFYKVKKPLAPYSFKAMAEYANYNNHTTDKDYYLKLTAEANFSWYYKAKKSIDLRLFGGGFLLNSDRYFGAMPLQMASRNINDYHYDELFIGRRQQSGSYSQQIQIADGGFKTPIASSVADGNSNSFLFAANFKCDLPIKLPFGVSWLAIKPYLDAGFFVNTAPSVQILQPADQIMVNGGLMLDIGNGAAAVYLPLFGTANLMQQTRSLGAWHLRTSFSLNTRAFSPNEIARTVSF